MILVLLPSLLVLRIIQCAETMYMQHQLKQVIVIARIFSQDKTPPLKYFVSYKSKALKLFNCSCQII